MIVCSMTVVIHSALRCALTAASVTGMTLLTYILLVNFLCSLVLIISLKSNGQDDIRFIGRQSMRVEAYNIGIAYPTLAHA